MGLGRLMGTLKSKLRNLKIMRNNNSNIHHAADHHSAAYSSSACNSSRGSSSRSNGYGRSNSYDKIEKSESMRVEIRSRKAQKLIQETLQVADSRSPRTKSYAF